MHNLYGVIKMRLVSKKVAKVDGAARGKGAASWMFDGNTTKETYRAFLDGFEDGDPAIMDAYAPPSWLSGEHAGESLNELLGEATTERDAERLDDVCATYEEAADRAYWGELVRVARLQTKHVPAIFVGPFPGYCAECGSRRGRGHLKTCSSH
jgi:hypothetical protein